MWPPLETEGTHAKKQIAPNSDDTSSINAGTDTTIIRPSSGIDRSLPENPVSRPMAAIAPNPAANDAPARILRSSTHCHTSE